MCRRHRTRARQEPRDMRMARPGDSRGKTRGGERVSADVYLAKVWNSCSKKFQESSSGRDCDIATSRFSREGRLYGWYNLLCGIPCAIRVWRCLPCQRHSLPPRWHPTARSRRICRLDRFHFRICSAAFQMDLNI